MMESAMAKRAYTLVMGIAIESRQLAAVDDFLEFFALMSVDDPIEVDDLANLVEEAGEAMAAPRPR